MSDPPQGENQSSDGHCGPRALEEFTGTKGEDFPGSIPSRICNKSVPATRTEVDHSILRFRPTCLRQAAWPRVPTFGLGVLCRSVQLGSFKMAGLRACVLDARSSPHPQCGARAHRAAGQAAVAQRRTFRVLLPPRRHASQLGFTSRRPPKAAARALAQAQLTHARSGQTRPDGRPEPT